MDRRAFLVTLVAAYGCGQREGPNKASDAPGPGQSAAAQAQKPKEVRRIGILTGGTVATSVPSTFFDGLRELGWIEGQNVIIERRGADGKSEAAPALAVELEGLKPDVIVTFGAVAGIAAKNATTTIPIVATSGDPVRLGLVSSMSHPGGNITGFSLISPELAAKRLELLRELIPKVTRVGEIVDRANQYWYLVKPDYERAFRSLGLQPIFVEITSSDGIAGAIAEIANRRAEALIVRGDPMLISNRGQIAQLALRYSLPTIAEERPMPAAGLLLSYGLSPPAATRRLASIVDRILRGAKPGDIPIEQPTKFELVINLKTAKALGLTVPQKLLLRADEVIE
jgi:putative ABC transport system substrate-binding protein